jgi:hypothetical protein
MTIPAKSFVPLLRAQVRKKLLAARILALALDLNVLTTPLPKVLLRFVLMWFAFRASAVNHKLCATLSAAAEPRATRMMRTALFVPDTSALHQTRRFAVQRRLLVALSQRVMALRTATPSLVAV